MLHVTYDIYKIKNLFKLFEVFIMSILSRKGFFDWFSDVLCVGAVMSGTGMMIFAKALSKAIRFGVGGALAGAGLIFKIFKFVILSKLSDCDCCDCCECSCDCNCSKDDPQSPLGGEPLTYTMSPSV
jgi:hypothetical protein